MKRHCLAVVWLCAAAMIPAEVSAQVIGSDSPPPESVRRPYRGLFGSFVDPNSSQSLTLSGSLFGAYDDNVTSGLLGGRSANRRLQRSGEYYGANAGLSYALSKSGERVTFGLASGATASGYYIDSDTNFAPHAHVTGNLRYALGRKTSIQFGQQVVYSRYYRFLLFPSLIGGDDDGALTGDPDLDLFARTALRYGTHVGFSRDLGSRSSLNAGYTFNYVDYRDDQYTDWRNHGGAIGFDHRVTAHATLNLGYGYRTAESPDGRHRSHEAHNINAGVAYARALSFSRRTSFSFGTGSAVYVRDDLTVPDSDPRTRFRLIGNATLNHELGRTWTAQAAYNRGLIFREGFDEPFLTDALSASIGGFVTRRLDTSAAARWSLASLDRPGQNQHNSFAATAQARYALSQFVALFARYVYYQYDFDEDVPLDPELPRSLDRQGFRVGVTASLPLIR